MTPYTFPVVSMLDAMDDVAALASVNCEDCGHPVTAHTSNGCNISMLEEVCGRIGRTCCGCESFEVIFEPQSLPKAVPSHLGRHPLTRRVPDAEARNALAGAPRTPVTTDEEHRRMDERRLSQLESAADYWG